MLCTPGSYYQDTWSCVSGQEGYKTHNVLFTGSGKFLISTPCISETTQRIFTKFIYFILYIYMTLHIKFERNHISGEQDIHFQKLPNFLHIFLLLLLLRTAIEEFLNHIKKPSHGYISFKFGTTIRHSKAYLSSKFGQF